MTGRTFHPGFTLLETLLAATILVAITMVVALLQRDAAAIPAGIARSEARLEAVRIESTLLDVWRARRARRAGEPILRTTPTELAFRTARPLLHDGPRLVDVCISLAEDASGGWRIEYEERPATRFALRGGDVPAPKPRRAVLWEACDAAWIEVASAVATGESGLGPRRVVWAAPEEATATEGPASARLRATREEVDLCVVLAAAPLR